MYILKIGMICLSSTPDLEDCEKGVESDSQGSQLYS